jgi:phosphoglycerate dehydrogenase-like enzyme
MAQGDPALGGSYRLLDLRPPGRAPIRVLVYHPLCQAYVRALSARLPLRDVTGPALEAEPLDTICALLTWKPPRALLDRLTHLRWIQTTSAGIDQILEFYRSHPDLVVTTTKGLQAESVSSLAITMLLAFFWGLPQLLDRQRRAVWEKHPVGVLSTQTCGVLGLGHVGRAVTAHARHLGMTVLAMRRTPMPVEGVARVVAETGLHEVLGAADYVVLALPLTEQTRGMFSEAEFRAMKRSAYLINVARGGIVDEAALVRALHAGEIAGAALDVFEDEPLPPGHPLWRAPNVILTPHMGGDRADYVEGAAAIFAENASLYPARDRMRGVASDVLGY